VEAKREGSRDCGDWCPAYGGDVEKAMNNCLPNFFLDSIKQMFWVLCADSLFAAKYRPTHGGTQHSNESCHRLIWSRCPNQRQSLVAEEVTHSSVCFGLLLSTMMVKWIGWRYSVT